MKLNWERIQNVHFANIGGVIGVNAYGAHISIVKQRGYIATINFTNMTVKPWLRTVKTQELMTLNQAKTWAEIALDELIAQVIDSKAYNLFLRRIEILNGYEALGTTITPAFTKNVLTASEKELKEMEFELTEVLDD